MARLGALHCARQLGRVQPASAARGVVRSSGQVLCILLGGRTCASYVRAARSIVVTILNAR